MHNVVYPKKTGKKYRYVRYYDPAYSHCNIAEAGFFTNNTDSIRLKGKCIGTSNGANGNGAHDFSNAYDENTLTSFDYYLPSGGWTGLDLGKPYPIGKSYSHRATVTIISARGTLMNYFILIQRNGFPPGRKTLMQILWYMPFLKTPYII